MIKYRNYRITYDPKPIPTRVFDYDFAHEDFDGAPDGPDTGCSDHRSGNAVSVDDAKAKIDEQFEDLGLDGEGHYA